MTFSSKSERLCEVGFLASESVSKLNDAVARRSPRASVIFRKHEDHVCSTQFCHEAFAQPTVLIIRITAL